MFKAVWIWRKNLGVGEVYNTAEADLQELSHELKSREIDVVVDTSGSQAGLDLSTDIVKRGGRINLFGWLKGQTASFDPTKWHLGDLPLSIPRRLQNCEILLNLRFA